MFGLGWGLFWAACAVLALGFEPFMTRARPGDEARVRASIEGAGMHYVGHRHADGWQRIWRQPSGKLARYVIADVLLPDGSEAEVELLLDPVNHPDFRISRVNKAVT